MIKNRVKINCQGGFTLIELIVATGILLIVTLATLNFFDFGFRNSLRTFGEGEVLMNARQSLLVMEREIRQANRPAIIMEGHGTVPQDLIGRAGVSITNNNRELEVFTFIQGEPKRVTYRLIENGGTLELQRSVNNVEQSPLQWQTLFGNIVDKQNHPYFAIEQNGSTIHIHFFLLDSQQKILRELEVRQSFTVRGRDVF